MESKQTGNGVFKSHRIEIYKQRRKSALDLFDHRMVLRLINCSIKQSICTRIWSHRYRFKGAMLCTIRILGEFRINSQSWNNRIILFAFWLLRDSVKASVVNNQVRSRMASFVFDLSFSPLVQDFFTWRCFDSVSSFTTSNSTWGGRCQFDVTPVDLWVGLEHWLTRIRRVKLRLVPYKFRSRSHRLILMRIVLHHETTHVVGHASDHLRQIRHPGDFGYNIGPVARSNDLNYPQWSRVVTIVG